MGLNEYDFGARFYDPAIGRWGCIDPMADAAPNWTPFRYGFNNPVNVIDPTGMLEYGVVDEESKYNQDAKQKEREKMNQLTSKGDNTVKVVDLPEVLILADKDERDYNQEHINAQFEWMANLAITEVQDDKNPKAKKDPARSAEVEPKGREISLEDLKKIPQNIQTINIGPFIYSVWYELYYFSVYQSDYIRICGSFIKLLTILIKEEPSNKKTSR